MAAEKKSFLLYSDIQSTVSLLSDQNAGVLFKHILAYVNDQHPVTDNDLVNLVFEPIKQGLKRDLEKWDNKKTERSNSGRLGNLKKYNPDLYQQVTNGQITIEEAENIAKHRKTSLSDNSDSTASHSVANIAVNDNVNVNVNDVLLEKEPKHTQEVNTTVEEKKRENFQNFEAPTTASPTRPAGTVEIFGDGTLQDTVRQYARDHPGRYPTDMYLDFLRYWTALLTSGTHKGKELWRHTKSRTWDLPGRLATWAKRETNQNTKTPRNNESKQQYLSRAAAELNDIFESKARHGNYFGTPTL